MILEVGVSQLFVSEIIGRNRRRKETGRKHSEILAVVVQSGSVWLPGRETHARKLNQKETGLMDTPADNPGWPQRTVILAILSPSSLSEPHVPSNLPLILSSCFTPCRPALSSHQPPQDSSWRPQQPTCLCSSATLPFPGSWSLWLYSKSGWADVTGPA